MRTDALQVYDSTHVLPASRRDSAAKERRTECAQAMPNTADAVTTLKSSCFRTAHLGVHLVQRTDEHLPQPAHRRRMLGLGTSAMATFVPDSMALERRSGKSRERKVLRAHASTHSYVWVRARACVRACASACLCGSVDVCNRRCNGQRVRALYPPAPRYTRCISHRRGCNQHIGMNATVILTWPPAGNRRLAKHSAPE